MSPLISICIPAYKNREYLQVLLNSISIQTFTDFEVLISDDSPGVEVELLCKDFSTRFTLIYHRNFPAKGSPANWNAAIKRASGQWIKLLHDDDWFATETSLACFAKAIRENPSTGFIFSGFSIYENGSLKYTDIINRSIQNQLTRSPLILFKKNYIGHPSTTLIKNDLDEWYDEKIKWVVDIEFYIRYLQKRSCYFIQEPLINIGINNEQITREAFRNVAIEIPENMYLLQKLGIAILKNILVYDYYWRLFRNLRIRDVKGVIEFCPGTDIPVQIEKMIAFESIFPISILNIGVISKFLMFLSYTNNLLPGTKESEA